MSKAIVLALIAMSVVLPPDSQAQLMCEPTNDPAEVEFLYDDLYNFLNALEKLSSTDDTAAILQTHYVDKASPGLAEFLRDNSVSVEDYVDVMRKKPNHYKSMVGLPEFLKAQEDEIREGLSRLQSKIPGATFLPVYYLAGLISGLHAEPSGYGLLLAFGNPGRNARSLVNTVVHETVHVQQFFTVGLDAYLSIYHGSGNLLAFAIREGVAEFLAGEFTGYISNSEARKYYLEHEGELIARFKLEMYNTTAGDWMWSKPKDPDQPQQVGYVLGSMIIKAFYDSAVDKSLAIKDILSITDYPAFYKKSGFGI
ncbi:MAG: hypothetical protein V3T31_08935 [candidate division Zixibacteria bacterium]